MIQIVSMKRLIIRAMEIIDRINEWFICQEI